LSNVNPATQDSEAVLRMLQAYRAASAAGRSGEADQLLSRVAQTAPGHPAVLNELGVRMMGAGAPDKARELFARATQADPTSPALWANLAPSLHALNFLPQELEALERALALEPRHTGSLLQKATLLEARGEVRNAARVYRNALATLPAGATPAPSIAEVVTHARRVIADDDTALTAAIEARVAGIRASHGGAGSRRVEHCLELLTGKRRRFDPQPTFMYFPELPAIEFLDREQFPWLQSLEAAAEDIRSELMNVLVADRAGLEAYIDYPAGVPLDQWRELNKSRRWSAYYLWNQSVPNPEHLARCPRTAQALQQTPQCDVAARAPTAFFSILEPHTRIPPHTGVTNTRLTVHLPLIVPPGCGFRVGGETREWVPGQAWVFDDTIEHEAWNESDEARAILIFDVWNPFLTPVERDLIRAMTEALGSYYGAAAQGAL
jgi:aspartyl/asparaginyl beta-hydroxylase (cupin superfamily)